MLGKGIITMTEAVDKDSEPTLAYDLAKWGREKHMDTDTNKDATPVDVIFDELLAQRKNVHGDFSDNCQMTSDFMDLLYGCPNWKNFTPLHKVGLYQILHKIGRIASGDPNYPDHWNDIAGYAIQTCKRLPKE